MPVSSVYEATENELRGSRMTISNLLKGVFKVIDFEITACTPTSMLMLKILMLHLSNMINQEFQEDKFKFLMVSFKAFNLLI